ncbi:hypothetical protein [Novosphingobium sp. KN65.2]|nr:hypothetical protein [Novosphingobium sp. KN65.2]
MQRKEDIGVLVGWSSQDLGTNLVVDLQTFEKTNWKAGEEPDHTRIFLTKSQAAVLANYLLKASGSLTPAKRKGFLHSLFD